MKHKKQQQPIQKGKHLDFVKRCRIEALLDEKYSYRSIAEVIGCSPSTISREINKHITIKKSHKNDCLNKSECTKHKVCGGTNCSYKCKKCNKCKHYCSDYVQAYCSILEEKNGLCNGCHKTGVCSFEQKFYKAEDAEKEYRDKLINTRNGFDLTGEELEIINGLVSPLIRKGQSPYHIKQTLGNTLTISESTLRKLINSNELDVRAIDLKEAVRRKPRKHRNSNTKELPSRAKIGHLYEDYLTYISENDVNIVEMDCVEGKQTDHCAILTLHFVNLHMQLYYIMPEHTAEYVVDTLDMIESTLGTELFRSVFELILTDNGHEFWDIDGMERSITGGKRTRIYFCEPNRSDQKGACENNHKIFRCIVPKSTSIDGFNQANMVLATNHVNSYVRKSLYGKCPYDEAMKWMPEDFFILLGLEKIEPKNVMLKPELINNNTSK